ncbi:MAG TPA: sugar phosphate isomerase/epimerase family protein [Thermoguttaceae bacterium]|nr:sugar phosphate isomerase/epimerase family protein [Thermoguttaceae bacterium]
MNRPRVTRREALLAVSGMPLAVSPALAALAADEKRRFKIGACDWSIGGRGEPGVLETAKRIGLDGVQVAFGAPGEKYDLRSEAVRREYLQAARTHGVEIASLAIGVLNQVPYASDPEAEKWVRQCVEVMPKLGQKVALVAFFSKGDIKGRRDLQDEVIRRLKRVAPEAEKAGVVLGIESWLSADDHLRILDGVGSPAVQVYYDVANMDHEGYDVYQGIRRLGRDRICEVHCKENGFLLGKGRIDFVRVKEALDEIGWSGWLVIEGAVPQGASMFDSYVRNQKYLRSIFPTGA